MKPVLVISAAPGVRSQVDHLIDLGHAAFRTIGATSVVQRWSDPGSAVLTTTRSGDTGRQLDGGRCVVLGRGARTHDGRSLDETHLVQLLRAHGREALSLLAPPAGVCYQLDDGPLVIGADHAGLRHVFTYQGPGWALAGTSIASLAMVVGASLDVEALAAMALIGHPIGRSTPFTGIEKLPAGSACELRAGELTLHDIQARPPTDRSAGTGVGRRPSGATVVAEAVRSSLRGVLDPVLELSGGLDSRMILAATPPDDRRRLRTVTIGSPLQADWRVADLLARRLRLDHRSIDITALQQVPPEDALEMATRSAIRRNLSSDAVAGGVFDWVEQRIGDDPRISGQNGEFARGFFYPAQLDRPRPTMALTRRLVRWRMSANAAAEDALFAPGTLADTSARVTRTLHDQLLRTGLRWLPATDELYLSERMQRWVGLEYSATCDQREILAPFFSMEYLTWARDLDPRQRRGSRAFVAALTEIDPLLASLPLASGPTPSDLAVTGVRGAVSQGTRTGRAALRKGAQRMRRSPPTPIGAAALASHVQQAWVAEPQLLERLSTLDLLDARCLEEVAGGRRPLRPSSVAFLVNVGTAVGLLDAAAAAARSHRPSP